MSTRAVSRRLAPSRSATSPARKASVGQAGALEGGGKGVGEAVPVPGDQRLHQRGRVPGEAPVDAVLQRPGPQGGPVPKRDGLRPLPAQQAVSLSREKDPLCGVVGDLLPRPAPVGQGTVGHGLYPVPGAQLSRLAVSKQQGGHRRPLRLHPHQHRPAVLPLLGPLRHRPGQADSPVIQRLGRPPEQGRIARRPEEPCRQAHGSPPHRQPRFFAPMREPGEQGSRQDQRAQQPQGAIQGQQGGAQSRCPKGKGEDGQPAHGLSPSSVYSVAYYSGFWRKVQAGTGSRP